MPENTPRVKNAFTLTELLVALGVMAVLAAVITPAAWNAFVQSSLAVSANNIRHLSVGAAQYLSDNRHVFWKYRENTPEGTIWWFGFETAQSRDRTPEGARTFDPERSPLSGYIPTGLRPDPSFRLGAPALKPKYQFGYIGIGYNVLLGGGWLGIDQPRNVWQLSDPSKVVVFATAAQINTFQPPASRKNPMLEDFYGIDDQNKTVHFRHGGFAMVAYANGSAGFLPMEESTRDKLLPQANVGLFAPPGSKKYLE